LKDTILAAHINRVLSERYGWNFRGDALFRVVWSDDQRELRRGVYEDYYRSTIYLRTVAEVRRAPKYSWLPEHWILERWFPGELLKAYHDELPDSHEGSYEAIYVFQDADGNALPLNEEFALAVVKSLMNIMSVAERRSRDKTEFELEKKKGHERDLMIMEEASPYLAGKLHGKEGIFFKGKKSCLH